MVKFSFAPFEASLSLKLIFVQLAFDVRRSRNTSQHFRIRDRSFVIPLASLPTFLIRTENSSEFKRKVFLRHAADKAFNLRVLKWPLISFHAEILDVHGASRQCYNVVKFSALKAFCSCFVEFVVAIKSIAYS